MLARLFYLAVGVIAFAVLRRREEPRPPDVRRDLLRFAAGALLAKLSVELHEPGALRRFSMLWGPLGAAGGLLMAWGLARLASYDGRRKDFWLRVPFTVMAIGAGLSGARWQPVAAMTIFATCAFRWRRVLPTGELFRTALLAVLLGVVCIRRWVPAEVPASLTLHGPARELWGIARWATMVAGAHAFLGVIPLLRAFLRDPTLGIRTVSRRIGLSHTLVLLVPLVITAGLWTLTTWLGVGADRALVAKRAFESESRHLGTALAQALRSGGSDDALRAVAEARHARFPSLRVWRVDATGFRRIAGDSVAAESRLPGWLAGRATLARAGVVQLGGNRYLGACTWDSASARGAVALVPVAEALADSLGRIVDATPSMRPFARPDTSDGAGDSLAAPAARSGSDSTRHAGAGARARSDAEPKAHVRFRGMRDEDEGGGDFRVDTDDSVFVGSGAAGSASQSKVSGVREESGAWSNDDFTLATRMTFANAVAGLYHHARENPYNALPIALLVLLVLLLIPVAMFNFSLVGALGRSVVQPFAAIRDGASALGEGRLGYRIPVLGDDELWDTARAFNQMAAGLERGRELEKERDRMEGELELARRIQTRLLPSHAPRLAGLEIEGRSEPAREVGGDYYDHLVLGDDRVLLVIADVSGKGVPAALLMSAFRASLMSQDPATGPAKMAVRLNEFLHHSVEPGKFVTAFVGILDGRTGRLAYANAGHNPPLLMRADGSAEWLAAGGLILGIMPESQFESGEAELRPGDLLLMYTDGVTEGADATGDQFGEDRLVETVRRRRSGSVGELAESIVREVRAFEGASGPADDLTVLAARRRVSVEA